MVWKYIGSFLNSFMPKLVRSGIPGYKILRSFRALDRTISNKRFWDYHRMAKGLFKGEQKAKDRSFVARVGEDEFVLQADPGGARYKYRFEAEVYNPLIGIEETRFFTGVSDRRVSPKTAWNRMLDSIGVGDPDYDLKINKVTYIGGLKRQVLSRRG